MRFHYPKYNPKKKTSPLKMYPKILQTSHFFFKSKTIKDISEPRKKIVDMSSGVFDLVFLRLVRTRNSALVTYVHRQHSVSTIYKRACVYLAGEGITRSAVWNSDYLSPTVAPKKPDSNVSRLCCCYCFVCVCGRARNTLFSMHNELVSSSHYLQL